MTVRPATAQDAAACAAVYAHWVEHSVATFDTTAPGTEHWAEKIAGAVVFVVVEQDGALAGFAYATPWRARPAYDGTVEDTVYLSPEHLGRGYGKALLGAVLEHLRGASYEQVIAVVADSGDPASTALHHSLGFSEAGRLRAVGRKHGRVLDTVLLQLSL